MSYAVLRQQAIDAGLLRRDPRQYVPLALGALTLGGAALSILVLGEGPWRFLAVLPLTQFWIQLGFIGHDTGHTQVFARTAPNVWLGRFCMTFLLGMSFRTWTVKHNLHHARTNEIEHDPDIRHPLLAFNESDALARRGFGRVVARYQAYLYPVLALLTTLGFRIDAWLFALGKTDPKMEVRGTPRQRGLELAFLVANAAAWLVLPSLLLGPLVWLPIFAVAQALLGVHMAMVFAPNHKGMEMVDERSGYDFVEQQVRTSRNVDGGPIVDWLYGGLNYQIEHHLFPTMARVHLGSARRLVRDHCARHGIPYAEAGLVAANREVFAALDELGRRAGGMAAPTPAPVLATVPAPISSTGLSGMDGPAR